MTRRVLIGLLIVLLLINDFVAWTELRHAMAWVLGDIAPVAAISMLFLANAVTMAFFFEGLRPRSIRALHGVAAFIYLAVLLAIYAAGVERGQDYLPPAVAEQAFGLSHDAAVRLAALIVSGVLSGATFVFWSVIGQLIAVNTARRNSVVWHARAAEAGLPVDNVLTMRDRPAV